MHFGSVRGTRFRIPSFGLRSWTAAVATDGFQFRVSGAEFGPAEAGIISGQFDGDLLC